MSIAKIMNEVKAVRGNHGVPTGVVDTLYVLEQFEKEEFCYEWQGFDNIFDYLEDLNERLIAENPDYEYTYEYTDEGCKDWIWKWGCGEYYFSAEEYGISNDISLSCYSNEPTGYDGVIAVFSVKLNNDEQFSTSGDEFSTCAATFFDVNGDCDIEYLMWDIINETREECYGEEEF